MTLRDTALEELTAWTPPDAAQAALRHEFLSHLTTRPDGVWRTCIPAHVTASAVILDEDREHALLVLHGKVGRWLQPGGHCEHDDESLAAAAQREAVEETGVAELRRVPGFLHLDRHPAPCNPGVVEAHLDVRFAFLAPTGAQPVPSAEAPDVRWWPLDTVLSDPTSDVVSLVRGALAFDAMIDR